MLQCSTLFAKLTLLFFSVTIGIYAAETPKHVRIIWSTNPQSEASIAWSSTSLGKKHVIYYDTEPRKTLADYRFKKVQDREGAYIGTDKPSTTFYYHHAQLSDLKPWTTHYFTIVGHKGNSQEFHFITAPDNPDQSFKFIAGGDSRSNRVNRRNINKLIAQQAAADKEIIALCHGGDYVDDGTSIHQWMAWLKDHAHCTTPTGRLLPIIPTRGNHEEKGELYNQIFDTPGGKDNYFALLLSPSVLLITLNTNIPTAGVQKTFLDSTLAKHQKVRWQLANYHSPVFPAFKPPHFAQMNWVPLFEKYNLDVAIECDGHLIKRTVPIRQHKHAKDGVVYVGEGGFGVDQRKPDTNLWYLKAPAKTGSDHHIQLFSFDKDTLNFKVLLLGGKEFDNHNFKARKR